MRLCILVQQEVSADGLLEECRITLEGEVALRLASRWAVFRNNARDRLHFEDLTSVLPMKGDKVLTTTTMFHLRAETRRSSENTTVGTRGSMPIEFGSLAGKVVFVIFWATWCAASHVPLASVVSIAQKHFGDGCDWQERVAILSVSLDDALDSVTRYLAQNGLEDRCQTVAHCWCGPKGWNGSAALSLGVKALPCALFLNDQLEVTWRGHPLRFNLEEEVQDLLDQGPPTNMCNGDDRVVSAQIRAPISSEDVAVRRE